MNGAAPRCKLRLGRATCRTREPRSRKSVPKHTAVSHTLASSSDVFHLPAPFFAFFPLFPLDQFLPICAGGAAIGDRIKRTSFPLDFCACIALIGFCTPAIRAFSSAKSQARSYAPSKSPPSICASPGQRSQYCLIEHLEQTGSCDSRTARTRFISGELDQISSNRCCRKLPVATGICTQGKTSPYGEM